ncbi:hypothetical protein NA56DRAFT_742510 [Hyaloscypha hepaticicola]|uniref:Uncharacterized protein n=1 Tax=Hyaloscypha hepaticicola TaxID=2082293 RepID=A0A2J6QQ12_9HELO|nr:hypothetical protein NA56DRAFT_742510 [Hyaloscypha hepaticicola]
MSSLCFRALWMLTPAIGSGRLTLPVEAPPEPQALRKSPRMRSLAHNLDKPRRVAWLHFAWRENNRVLQKAEMKVQGVRGHKHTLISISHAHADAYANAPMRMQNTIELLEMQAQGGLALRWQRTRG